VAIDLETTGTDSRVDTIVELAAVRFVRSRVAGGYVTHVNPERPIPPESIRVHGITEAMVAGAPTLDEALPKLEAVCGDHVLVGYAIDFDLAVLARQLRVRGRVPLTNAALDCRRLAVVLHPEWKALGFDEVATQMGIGILGRHTAEGDALAAAELFLALIPEIQAGGVATIGDLLWLQESTKPASLT
jgi:DNA polymerase-3 subunit epsilon/CBS domain-containing protein